MAGTYVPGPVPEQYSRGVLEGELQKIAQALDELAFGSAPVRYAEPEKVWEGMIVIADGTDWDPGSGPGFYGYRSGAWVFLG